MGTSSQNPGSRSDTPFVPAFQDEENEAPIPSQTRLQRFREARASYSRFASSGGTDRQSMQRAVRTYVRSSVGGTGNAVRRMGPSLRAANRALVVLRRFLQEGEAETLVQLRLENLVGKNVSEIFTGLTEFVCRDGGSIDDAIARDAWLETIAELDSLAVDNLDGFSEDQICEVFLMFVGHTIKTRLYQDIGINGLKFAAGIDEIDRIDQQFKEYILRSVRDSFTGDISKLSSMTDEDVAEVVEGTYTEAWHILQLESQSQE